MTQCNHGDKFQIGQPPSRLDTNIYYVLGIFKMIYVITDWSVTDTETMVGDKADKTCVTITEEGQKAAGLDFKIWIMDLIICLVSLVTAGILYYNLQVKVGNIGYDASHVVIAAAITTGIVLTLAVVALEVRSKIFLEYLRNIDIDNFTDRPQT